MKEIFESSNHRNFRGIINFEVTTYILSLEAIVSPSKNSKTLEFRSPVRDFIKQEIPYINQTPFVWNMKAEIRTVFYRSSDW